MAATNTPPSSNRSLAPAVPSRPMGQPPQGKMAPRKRLINIGALPFWLGLLVSVVWVGVVFIIVAKSGPSHTFAGVPLSTWAIGVSSMVSPIALIWMVVAYLQRAADVQSVAEPLRRQLMMITGESGAAEARIRRFNQAVREQVELLRNTQSMTHGDMTAVIERVRAHKDDLERFEHASIHQVKEIQEIVRRNMQQVEALMDDKFTMMRVLDDKLVQNGDSVARQTESVRNQISDLLEEMQTHSTSVAEALDRAAKDGKKLTDTTRAQEATLLTAAETAAEALGSVSSKIDLSVARFLERAGSAREEAERLAGALDAQTRSLDEFSNMLPARVSEAESVIRGVADRLYASEQLAREQAIHLSEKLSLQVDGLQQFMDRFTARLGDIDGSLSQRHNELDSLAGRITTTTENFSREWEQSVVNLNDRTNNTLMRFTVLNDETRKGAESVAQHLTETTGKYEDVTYRMRKLTDESSEQMKGMTVEITGHLSHFESLREAANKAGEDVQSRAAGAMQNLQYVLERLLSARDATQSVGGTLIKDLYGAVDQNEQLISRLNEAAQMSVRALGIATESLGKQEGELSDRTRAAQAMLQEATQQLQQQAMIAEKGLREQATGLMGLLGETQNQMNATDQKMQGFAARAVAPVQDVIRQIDVSAEQGVQSMVRYGDGLQEQLGRLQQFNTRVGGMGEDLGRVTTETLTTIEQLNSRFVAVRTVQEETARQTLEQFSNISERLQKEVGGLDSQTAQAVTTLQQAASRVGEQSFQLLQDAENSGAKMQLITSALQNEAAQIRSILQKQADDLGADLSRAEKQFSTLGDALKQRTDAAYALLDRVATHYNETTRAASTDLEARTQRLEQATTQAQGKAEMLNATLSQQLSLIGNGTTQMEAQAAQIGHFSGKTLQQLSALNEKITITHEAANTNTQQALSRLEECNTSFMRQSNGLSEAAQTSVTLIQKAGSIFGEQAGKMLDTSHQIEQNMRQLSATTSALADQSAQMRSNMEQHNQRLLAQLTEAVGQLEATGSKLEQTTAIASLGADQVAARFNEMTLTATSRLTTSNQEMQMVAGKAETTLTSIGTNITQQAASLAIISDQLSEQYSTLTSATEQQRTQLLDLFDKLGSAHGQASEVADRTINRLGEALNQIQRSLGSLSDQSQTAVGNVRTASSGFAEQAGMLIQNAQAAEQQARTVLSVTGALQDQARQLREALHGEGERAGDMLSNLMSKLSAGGMELRELSSSTEMSLTSLHNDVTQHSQGLTSTMQQITDRQRSLTTALDAQRDVLNGLLSRLGLAQDETASIAERTVARLTDGAQQIAKQSEIIGAQAQNALASVQAAGAGFADEAGSLSLQAQQAEQQMRGVLSVTAGMQEQARQLRETMQSETARVVEQLNAVVTQLDVTNSQLKTQSGAAMHVMEQSSIKFAQFASVSTDGLTKQSEALNKTVEYAETRIEGVSEKIRGHLKLVGDLGEQTEAKAHQLADSAEFATGRLITLRETLADSDKDGQSVLAQASARVTEVKMMLQVELQRLTDLSQQSVYQVTTASQQLAAQSDVLRANLATSESALSEAATLVRDETIQLPVTLDRSTAQIETALRVLKNSAEEADGILIGTADRFITVTTTARESMSDEMRRVSTIADQADQVLRQFNKALAEQVASMQQGSALLSSGQQELVERASESIHQLTEASDRLARLRSDATQTAEKLVREFDTLDQRATATGQRLAQTGDVVVKNMEALSQSAQRAEGQMLGASSQFREQLERIRGGLQGQIDDINRGLMQITAQLERTGNTLRGTTAGTVADVERISQRFDQTSKEASTQLTDKTARMRAATEEVAKLLSGFGDQLDTLLDRLAVAGDGIRRNEGGLVDQMQAALTHLGTVTDRLETSRALTTTVSEQTVAKLTEVVDTIQNQMQGLSSGSQTAAGIMRGVGQIYGDQTQAMNTSVKEAHNQVMSMNKSIDEMQARTDRMRITLKMQGEELMGSLQQILKQLYSTGEALSDNVEDARTSADGFKKIG